MPRNLQKPVWTIIANAAKLKGGAEHGYFFTTQQPNKKGKTTKARKEILIYNKQKN